jgi:hypothetical protein
MASYYSLKTRHCTATNYKCVWTRPLYRSGREIQRWWLRRTVCKLRKSRPRLYSGSRKILQTMANGI